MKTDKVTRNVLRAMPWNRTESFELPNASACLSANATAHQLGKVDRCKYTIKTDFKNYVVKITKTQLNLKPVVK